VVCRGDVRTDGNIHAKIRVALAKTIPTACRKNLTTSAATDEDHTNPTQAAVTVRQHES